ncbi:cysteine proteinase inhibitor 5-like [Momordica charantia]|uniref:Cysteine proteinase inhibitor 5-like n=1 Tax=Momordica charantia TaxID=3673 RepID=A0A6J1DV34_MOMCH|nr:cysteine proteinase inhibitor 5-like [Momordica charantia]
MKFFSAPLFLVVLLPAMVAAAAPSPSPVYQPSQGGQYEPIKNLSDPYISEIGRYACIEYNRKYPSPTPLVFQKVVSGEKQVVNGYNYKLIMYIKSGGLIPQYEVIVYDIPWKSHRELTSLNIYHN